MEALSEENRILCSQRAATLLADQEPNMPLEMRGPVDVGKGITVEAFWVNEGETIKFESDSERSESLDAVHIVL